ncbi:fasciclin domain-containing protein [Anabaena sp. UHCC 0187]|uniref:fasciclin domain-containing protein n=1 Tax=Anabaena sp. UHCC 0187 TaxID=2590018 RepID=UPI001445A335|nr:fasciclin domain-containing protein [Anabaena sp. UHCC 0187]MDP5016946.1 fasciclin domain-containing protein [Dolichospermum sp.]MTJ13695.1 fasciclin domain-containing protein [Anabaena sp. UHCC 0187]
MNANYSKLLTKITAIMGLMSIGLLTTIPSPAQTQQRRNTTTRPSIFNEPPYNRGRKPSETAPVSEPSQPETEVPTAPVSKPMQSTLVDLAKNNKSFTTLAKALEAAGLTETLQGAGPFTIFAPTDAAFAKLPADALKDLLKPENKEVLVKILTYHVVPGKVFSTDLKSGEVKSVEGGAIIVKVDPAKGVTVNDAKVTQADIEGSNGVIHAIDNVILPPDL